MLWTLQAKLPLPLPQICPPEPLMGPAYVEHALNNRSSSFLQACMTLLASPTQLPVVGRWGLPFGRVAQAPKEIHQSDRTLA